MIPQIIRAASKFIPKVLPKMKSNIVKTATKTSRGIKDAIIRSRSHKIIGGTAARTRVIQNVDKYYLNEINKLKDTYRSTSKFSSKIIKLGKESLKTMPAGGSVTTRKKIAEGIRKQVEDMIKRTAKSGAPARAQLRNLIRERKIANQFLKTNYKDIVKNTVNRTRILRNRGARESLRRAEASGMYQTPKQIKEMLRAETRLNSKGKMVRIYSDDAINQIVKSNRLGQISMGNQSGLFSGLSTGLHEVKHSVQYNLSKALQKALSKGVGNTGGFRPRAFIEHAGNPLYKSIDDIIHGAGNLTARHARPNSSVMQLAKRLQREGIIPRHLNANTINYRGLHNAMLNIRGGFANPTSTMYKGPGTFKRLFPGGEKQFKTIQAFITKTMQRRRGDLTNIPGYYRRNFEISTRLDEIRNVPGLQTLLRKTIESGAQGDKTLKYLARKFGPIKDLLSVMSRTNLRKALDNAWMGIPGLPMLDYLDEDK